jgi:glycine cleavage system H protein
MRQYFKTHEWIQTTESGNFLMGVSQYACDQLGDIVFVEPKESGEEIAEGDSLAILESVKAVGDVYAPFKAKVTAVNPAAIESPEEINGDTWLVEIEPVGAKIDISDLDACDKEDYEEMLENLAAN